MEIPEVMELVNEFASVRISIDSSANGPRLKITETATGLSTHLDPVELQSLAWIRRCDFDSIVTPAYREEVLATLGSSPAGVGLVARGERLLAEGQARR